MKITCNVIEDLLPLYVDDMVSADSQRLVEEHVSECESCKKKLEDYRQAEVYENSVNVSQEGALHSVAPLRAIRHKIRKRQILSVGLAVIMLLLAVRVGHYFYYEKAAYIPWEESGLEIEDGKLYATRTCDGRFSGLLSADQKVKFMIGSETPYIEKLYPDSACHIQIEDFNQQHEMKEQSDQGIAGLEKVYYLPAEYLDFHFDTDDIKTWEQQSRELEEKALLIWEADTENSTQQKQSWTPPAGSHKDKNGNIVDKDGAVIGNDPNETFIPNPDAVG